MSAPQIAKAQPPAKEANGLRYPYAVPPQGEPLEVADGVFWLRMPLPFTLDHINLWLLRDGDAWTLIDTGVDTLQLRSLWDQVLAGPMQGQGFKRVIVTHLHPDHVGLAGWLTRRYDAEFMMSRTDYLMCRMLAADTGRTAPEEGLRFYRAAGFSEEALRHYGERFGFFGKLIDRMPESYTRLRQGDALTINGRRWEIEVGAGHAPEHLCLVCPSLNVCVAGDQILPRISSNVSLFPTEPTANPLQDWLDSCARLRACLPEDCLILPAHNEPFYGVRERLTSLIDSHETSLARLLKVLEARPCAASDGEVFSSLFKRKVKGEQMFMAVGESLAHLSCLEQRGLATHEMDANGVRQYRAASAGAAS